MAVDVSYLKSKPQQINNPYVLIYHLQVEKYYNKGL